MTEAAALIRSTVDRILRLKEEIDNLNDDIKEVYAEAKANGLDKSALGALVTEIRKVNRLGADRIEEASTILDTYRDAYEAGIIRSPSRAHTHTHARESHTDNPAATSRPAESGAALPTASAPHIEFVQPDHAGDSTDPTPQAPSVGSPSVDGSAAAACSETMPAHVAMASGPFSSSLAGPSGPAPLGGFDALDDMPAFLRRPKPTSTALTA